MTTPRHRIARAALIGAIVAVVASVVIVLVRKEPEPARVPEYVERHKGTGR